MQTPITQSEFDKLVKNCDIVLYENLVLNVSKFDHPGGSSFLKQKQGCDISESFKATSHSLNAKIMLRDLVIGYLVNDHIKVPKTQLFTCEEIKTVNIYDKIKAKFDPDQPIGDQVALFTREEFITFLNYPKFIKDGQVLEIDKQHSDADKTEFWVNIPVQAVVWIILFSLSMSQCSSFVDIFAFVLCFVMAMFAWSVIEYYFHRIKLHREIDLAETAKPEQFVELAQSHLIHHAFPTYPLSIVLQLKTTLPALSVIFLSLYFVINLKVGLFVVTGLLLCVIGYDCLHYFFHFGWQPTWPLIAKLKKNHLKHHYKNTNKGFGVTTTFWDRVFNTQHI